MMKQLWNGIVYFWNFMKPAAIVVGGVAVVVGVATTYGTSAKDQEPDKTPSPMVAEPEEIGDIIIIQKEAAKAFMIEGQEPIDPSRVIPKDACMRYSGNGLLGGEAFYFRKDCFPDSSFDRKFEACFEGDCVEQRQMNTTVGYSGNIANFCTEEEFFELED